MTKVYISPTNDEIDQSNGIGRVVHAQFRYLPNYGIEIVDNEKDADIIACHISQRGKSRVDVLHCHGLYWTGDPWSGSYVNWQHRANYDIIDAARKALRVTVPSAWVAEPFRRDMRLSPDVIGHGINIGEWKVFDTDVGIGNGYILWNKNRAGDVCDPKAAVELAKRGFRVVSTYGTGEEVATLKVTGSMSHVEMSKLIHNAEIYLATTQETFGIGTLEAIACGIPVLGYSFGGTKDIVSHRNNGYLVEHGDIDSLVRGVDYIRKNYARMSAAARKTAERYTWDAVIGKYAKLYKDAAEERRNESNGVAVVITNHNYKKYVGGAIRSVLEQTDEPEEIIVVDDGSNDNSLEIIDNMPITKVIKQNNLGVAAARNNGIKAAKSPFIICLDADDELHPAFIKTLRKALASDRGMGIVYTGITIVEDGKEYRVGWPPEFSWKILSKVSNPPSNCIPSACMFRKSMWERCGGYIQSHAPGEDTEFWVRGLSTGFTAKRVSDEGLFRYRVHGGSASRTKKYNAIDLWHPWMRDKKYPMGAPSTTAPIIRSYSEPLVSIVIPVGPGHGKYLQAAIDSVIGQTWREWELIIVNDSGEELPLKPYPFAKVFVTDGGTGAANSRNIGVKKSTAPLIFFLDADDYLDPLALEKTVNKFEKSGGDRYVYTDFYSISGDKKVASHKTKEYNQSEWGWQHNIGALVPRKWILSVGGFDDFINEDWAFWVKMAINGYCGVRLPVPLYYYRMATGKRRDEGFTPRNLKRTLSELNEAYGDYYTGKKKMSGCCGDGGDAIIRAKIRLGILPASDYASDTKGVDHMSTRLEFTGDAVGSVSFVVNGRRYKGGNNAIHRFINAHKDDVDRLVSTGKWRVVREPQVREPEIVIVEADEEIAVHALEEKAPEVKEEKVSIAKNTEAAKETVKETVKPATKRRGRKRKTSSV